MYDDNPQVAQLCPHVYVEGPASTPAGGAFAYPQTPHGTKREATVATPPVPPTPPPSGPICALCGERAVVVWQRRLTDTEFAAYSTLEQEKRDGWLALADPQKPPPDYGPLPQPSDCTAPVYGCTAHAITMDAAALIHAKTCTAPNAANLPGCNCTPEPLPPPSPAAAPALSPLPDHWTT